MAAARCSSRSLLSRACGAPAARRCIRPRRAVVVKAAAEPQEVQQRQELGGEQQQQQHLRASSQPMALSLKQGWQRFMERYEHNMVSAGVGALVVTTYCVSRGQDPAQAAMITLWATVAAMVANELLFAPAPPAE